MATYHAYGWNLDHFEGDLFHGMIPKSVKGKSRKEQLEIYFDEDSAVNIFHLEDGMILGILLHDNFQYDELRRRLLSSIENRVGKFTTNKFDLFLNLYQPRLYKVVI